jgi:hypothetical protein
VIQDPVIPFLHSSSRWAEEERETLETWVFDSDTTMRHLKHRPCTYQ